MSITFEYTEQEIKALTRCSRCLLPFTFPFIQYDENGICNYCKHYFYEPPYKENELSQLVQRSTNDEYDCMVMFSGGRDSSYLLHYVVSVLGLRSLAYTYDWGMCTPIASRNMERLCKALNVHLVTVNADIGKKLSNISKNVSAWLKKPNIGLIPLFMAGDKQFFRHANQIANEYKIENVFLGMNPFEKTDFKTGFCGVAPNFSGERIHSITTGGKIKMMGFYAKQFLRNPAFINRSIGDTLSAFMSFYQIPQKQIDIYKYIAWDEETIDNTLIDTYGWETDPKCSTTWRIGDGTAAFYNYIYCTVAGFTENDTLRSNQIRAGVLSREEAMEKIIKENAPRVDSILWYLDRIDIDAKVAISTINNIPKLYREVKSV